MMVCPVCGVIHGITDDENEYELCERHYKAFMGDFYYLIEADIPERDVDSLVNLSKKDFERDIVLTGNSLFLSKREIHSLGLGGEDMTKLKVPYFFVSTDTYEGLLNMIQTTSRLRTIH